MFRKKKYNLTYADSALNVNCDSSSNSGGSRCSSNSSLGYSSGSGETLSRRKEQRKFQGINLTVGSLDDSGPLSLNEDKYRQLVLREVSQKRGRNPVFEQGTPSMSTNSTSGSQERTRLNMDANDRLFEEESQTVLYDGQSLRPQVSYRWGEEELITKSIDKPGQQRQSAVLSKKQPAPQIGKKCSGDKSDFQLNGDKVTSGTLGPTNIDDVIRNVGLNHDEHLLQNNDTDNNNTDNNNTDNTNNNNNNTANIVHINPSLRDALHSGNPEIKSLRQVLKSPSRVSISTSNKDIFMKKLDPDLRAETILLTDKTATSILTAEKDLSEETPTNRRSEKVDALTSSHSPTKPPRHQIESNAFSASEVSKSLKDDAMGDSHGAKNHDVTLSVSMTSSTTISATHCNTSDADMLDNRDDNEGNVTTRVFVGSGELPHQANHHEGDNTSEVTNGNSTASTNLVSRIIIKNDQMFISEDKNKENKNEYLQNSSPVTSSLSPPLDNNKPQTEIVDNNSTETKDTSVDPNLYENEKKMSNSNESNPGISDKVENRDTILPVVDEVTVHQSNHQQLDETTPSQQLDETTPSLQQPPTQNYSTSISSRQSNEIPTKEETSTPLKQRPKTVGKFTMNAGSLNASGTSATIIKKKFSGSGEDEGGKVAGHEEEEEEEEHEYFKRRKRGTIAGRNGSFRGIKDLVKSGISTFANIEDCLTRKNIMEQSKGRILFFTTSMSAIRTTRDKCSGIKKILQNHRIYFEERDVYISNDNAKELIQRFKLEHRRRGSDSSADDDSRRCSISRTNSSGYEYTKDEYEEMLLKLPRVFVEDFDLGGYEEVNKLNETDVLKKIFHDFPKVQGEMTCAGCGGFRYTPCYSCHGSKRSRSNAFTEEFMSLRCTKCDENGLARCKVCNTDQTSSEGSENNSIVTEQLERRE